MASSSPPLEDRRSFGIGILLFAQLFFAALDSSAKWMAVSGIATPEIIFIRYGVHVALGIALFLPVTGLKLFHTNAWRLELLRGLCLLGTTFANFFAMQFLPLTVTGALLFTMPLMVTMLSVLMLGETVGTRRWIAVGVGFIGVLVIVRPGSEAFHPASILALLGALCAALYSIFTRKLAGIDAAVTQQIYAGVISLVCITPFAFHDWTWPSDAPTWAAFCLAGVFGFLAHQLNSIALRHASPSVLAPFTYSELLLLALASWLVFNEPPDIWFALGAPIIVASGVYIWLRERAAHKVSVAGVVD